MVVETFALVAQFVGRENVLCVQLHLDICIGVAAGCVDVGLLCFQCPCPFSLPCLRISVARVCHMPARFSCSYIFGPWWNVAEISSSIAIRS